MSELWPATLSVAAAGAAHRWPCARCTTATVASGRRCGPTTTRGCARGRPRPRREAARRWASASSCATSTVRARHGRLQPFAIEVNGRLVGQMHLFGIAWGSMRSAAAGYWIAESVAGQGITPLALALATDYGMTGLGLHRVEVNIRPDNVASLRVVHKLGFPRRGRPVPLPAHQRCLARPPDVRADDRGPGRNEPRPAARAHLAAVARATHRRGSAVRRLIPLKLGRVQPSSLIFLVIIAIWAAYLLQHWIRRREHLVTARSIDRFSEAMRVLERRTALTEATMSAPSPRSYAVSPARPSRPEVVVKRAQPSVAARRLVRPPRRCSRAARSRPSAACPAAGSGACRCWPRSRCWSSSLPSPFSARSPA